jgi:dihydropteroate synthase
MGIVNCTPDSFSGDGRPTVAAVVAHGLRLAEEGADVLDVGGESTRPGAAPVPAEEELRRVLPVVEALAARIAGPLLVLAEPRPLGSARRRPRPYSWSLISLQAETTLWCQPRT